MYSLNKKTILPKKAVLLRLDWVHMR